MLGSKRTAKKARTTGGFQTGRVLGNGIQFLSGIFILSFTNRVLQHWGFIYPNATEAWCAF